MENEFKGTRLTLEIGDVKMTWESPYDDHSMSDILEALRGLAVGQTFLDETFVRCCGDLYENNIFLYEPEKKEDK